MIELNLTWNLVVVALTLSSFTLLRIACKPTLHIGDKLLSVWLLILLAPLISSMLDLINGDEIMSLSPWLNPALSLLHGPMLFVYVQQLVNRPRRFKLSDAFHLLPFAIFYLLFIFAQPLDPILPNPNARQDITQLATVNESSNTQSIFKYFGEFNLIIFVGYACATIVLLVRHQQKISDYFSQRDINISLAWVYAIPVVFGFLVVLNVLNEWVSIPMFDPLQAHLSSYVFFIALLCFFGIEQAPLFLITDHQELKSIPKESAAEDSISLAFDPIELKQIQTLMENKKPFLNPDFTVYQLASSLGIPRRRLSLLLNSGFNKNFFQFVNEFRVNEVKELLRDKGQVHFTLLDIALESGFKSKSTFNSIFKQYTGLTPSQYRKQNSVDER